MTEAKVKPADKTPAKRSGRKPTKADLEKIVEQRDAEIEQLKSYVKRKQLKIDQLYRDLERAATDLEAAAEATVQCEMDLMFAQEIKSRTLSQRIKAVFTG